MRQIAYVVSFSNNRWVEQLFRRGAPVEVKETLTTAAVFNQILTTPPSDGFKMQSKPEKPDDSIC